MCVVACSNASSYMCCTTVSTCVPIAPGPWYVAEVLTGSYGFIGAHGVYVSGHFLPGSMTYLYGTLQVSFSTMQYLYLLYIGYMYVQLYKASTSHSLELL